jgi:RNA polymerase sigma factor (sigma-70 family)
MQQYTDQEIIDMFQNEDSRNLSIHFMMKQYQVRLYWHIRKIVIDHDDADDVLQNTGEAKISTWLYRIGTNESISFLRKKRSNMVSIHPVEYHLSNQLSSDPLYEGDKIQLNLQKAILTLPEKQRIVFNMRYYDETPYEEMAQILETSVGALKASYHIAAKKIEEILLKH